MQKTLKETNERLAELYANLAIINRKIELAIKDLDSAIKEPAIYNCLKKLYLERLEAQDEITEYEKRKNLF